MQEPKLYWGITIDKAAPKCYSLGLNITKEDINGKTSFYLHLGLIFFSVSIGRLW
jgi:hypothetical protein